MATALAAALALTALPAAAQMFERAYSFAPRDRASLAVIMKQAENGMFEPQRQPTATGATGTPLQYTVNNLICGGDSGSANAEGNSACIILNNAQAAVAADQGAMGNQDAASSVDTTQNNNSSGSISSALDGTGGTASADGGTSSTTQ
jgi:hypothetical protein